MSPEEWKKVSAALDELIDMPEERRAVRLQRLRAEDPALCQEVESLLKQRDPTARLDAPPPQLLGTLRSEPRGGAAPAADETFGPLLDRQRDGWGRGEPILVEALLADHPTLRDDRERLLDLVWNEVDLRAARGETPRLEEYQKRFPELSDDLRKQFEVFAALETADQTPLLNDRGAGAPVAPRLDGYEILGDLGRGGMGVVYKARQIALDRVVAVKMILPAACADAEELHRFRAEAEAVARLHHPNIIQIHHVGEQAGRPFLVLEFAAGGGLDRRLAGTPLPADQAARLVETLARAVHHAHEKGVIHRDLKPANVLLAEDGTPKVTDFGLARRLDEVGRTQTGAVMGTPSYMAPEQAAGRSKEIGPAADVYALGAILYECLTGRPPFKAAVMLDTLMQVRNDEPVPPRQLQSKTPRDLQTICLKCLQKDPKKRYAGAAALAEDLRRYQAGEPIAARPARRLERAWRWGRRNPKDAALIAAGLVAVVIGVVVYLWVAGVRQAAEQDRRDRQARATAEAERKLADATSLLAQARTAAVGDSLPWERALDAARHVQEFVRENPVDELTGRRVSQTAADVIAGKQEAEQRAATTARDRWMKEQLTRMALDLEPQLDDKGTSLIHAAPDYGTFFAAYGIDPNRPDEAAARIQASAIKADLIAGLDAWMRVLLTEDAMRRRVADLANRVSEPDEFRRRLRDAVVAQNINEEVRLARENAGKVPLDVAYDVASLLIGAQNYAAAVDFLRPAQRLYPGDFAINFLLAHSLEQLNPHAGVGNPYRDDAIRFFTVAAALRPDDGRPHYRLGTALFNWGKPDEALAELRTAVRLDPRRADAQHYLGLAELQHGNLNGALDALHEALDLLKPDDGQRIGWKLQFALYCENARKPVTAARLFKETFAEQAGGAGMNGWLAAIAAAQAVAGKGEAPVTDTERADLEARAREWLRSSLRCEEQLAQNPQPAFRKNAAGQLRAWQRNPELAVFHDETELKKLPADEQAAWRQLWADVAASADRMEKP